MTTRKSVQKERKYQDPLCRFTATPLTTDLQAMGRTVRLETNSATVLARMVGLFERYGRAPVTPRKPVRRPDFLWRIVGETNSDLKPPWPKMTAFSDDGLRYVNFGQRNFLAVDLEAREAVAFLSEELANDELGFSSIFASTLFDLTAPAMKLMPVAAACVALNGKALLIFGPPTSGKTTSTYLAGRQGLEFHADQVTYLDLKRNSIQAWGQFWPAAFRPETIRYLPELSTVVRPLSGQRFTLLCVPGSQLGCSQPRGVVPVAGIFLERRTTSTACLIRLSRPQASSSVMEIVPFRDDKCFEPRQSAILSTVARMPVYRLCYGPDPADAAPIFRRLLTAHGLRRKGQETAQERSRCLRKLPQSTHR